MTIPVITISNRIPDPVRESYYHYEEFLRSCARQDFDPIFLAGEPLPGARNSAYRGLNSKPKLLYQWIEQNGANFEWLIFCDAWDILWLSKPSDVIYNMGAFSAPIVFNAESNCFPVSGLAESFDAIAPKSPTGEKAKYRYLNSGFFCGNTQAIRAMLKEMDVMNLEEDSKQSDGHWRTPNDQEFYQRHFLKHVGENKMALDYAGILCQSLHGSDEREFALFPERKRIVSLLSHNEPICVHGNGGGKEWLARIIKWMGL